MDQLSPLNSRQGFGSLWQSGEGVSPSWIISASDSLAHLRGLETNRFQCAVTSPPYYWQRDYGIDGQIGLESSISEYVSNVANCMDEVRRVVRKDGVLFLNLGDTYYSAKGKPKGDDKKSRARRFGLRAVDGPGLGVPRKTIIGIPWRVAIEMITRGWILRAPIIWERPNPLPEPTAHDRPWRTYEFVFMFAKSPRYYFDRSVLGLEEDVWEIGTRPNSSGGLHQAAFPERLARRCIELSTKENDEVLDPFCGSGSTIAAALKANRRAYGIDLNEKFCEFSAERARDLT